MRLIPRKRVFPFKKIVRCLRIEFFCMISIVRQTEANHRLPNQQYKQSYDGEMKRRWHMRENPGITCVILLIDMILPTDTTVPTGKKK